MTTLIGSFIAGGLWQLASTRFLCRKSSDGQLVSFWVTTKGVWSRLVVAYLLVHIGLVGGAEIAGEGPASLAISGLLNIGLAATLFMTALLVLRWRDVADRKTRISLATHYGSVSVGTFAAAQAFLASRGIPFDPSTAAWLALMEVPAILIGAMVLGGGLGSLKRALGDWDILLLIGSLALGYAVGPGLVRRLDFLIVAPFEMVLAYFLFTMGQHAGEHITHLRNGGAELIAFGVLVPVFGGVLGGLAGTLADIPLGNVILLSTLSASASYVAATAAMSKLVPLEAVATSLTVSLGVTLPWNILVGIRLYTFIAQALAEASVQWLPATAVYVPQGTDLWLVAAVAVRGLAVVSLGLVYLTLIREGSWAVLVRPATTALQLAVARYVSTLWSGPVVVHRIGHRAVIRWITLRVMASRIWSSIHRSLHYGISMLAVAAQALMLCLQRMLLNLPPHRPIPP